MNPIDFSRDDATAEILERDPKKPMLSIIAKWRVRTINIAARGHLISLILLPVGRVIGDQIN
jgi:hypothetical protein